MTLTNGGVIESGTSYLVGEAGPEKVLATMTGYSGIGGINILSTTYQWSYPNYPVGPYYGWSYPVYPTIITYPVMSPDLERKLDDLTAEVRKLRRELKKERSK